MRRGFGFATAVLAVGLCFGACVLGPPPERGPSPRRPTPAELTGIQWLEDLEALQKNLRIVHEAVVFSPSRFGVFEELTREMRGEIVTMGRDERIVALLRAVAALGDPHTRIEFTPERVFPIELLWFKEGIFVTRTVPDCREALNAQVLGLNGTPVEAVVTALRDLIAHENEAQVRNKAPALLVQAEILHGLGLIPDVAEAVWTLRAEDGTEFDLSIEAGSPVDWREGTEMMEPGPIPLYLRNEGLFYWYHYLEDSQTVFFQSNACLEMRDRPFHEFSREMLSIVRGRPVRRVVVDLRRNSGGISSFLRPLVRDLAGIGKINRRGGLYVIVGRKTFSAAILACLEFKARTEAVFVGEPTGGKPSHYGDIHYFRLPHSQLPVWYSTRYLYRGGNREASLIPDYVVEPSIHDHLAGRDPALEGILRGDFK